ncbi:MAG TPA: maltotransferase domain-containing protein [Pseudonocardiaceae bacterium]|nr:maltotransferase domain-containing protein [Pseudonocardiaceae bacterium]
MVGRIVVEDVRPVVSDGRYPARAVVGEHLPVSATVWREGHDTIAARVLWQSPGGERTSPTRMALTEPGLDLFTAVVVPDTVGRWSFRVEAWCDPWATWLRKMAANIAACLCAPELANDFEDGARLLERVAYRPDRRADRDSLLDTAAHLRDPYLLPRERMTAATAERVASVMREHPVRELLTRGQTYDVWVDRPRAAAGAWYEMFPRSTGGLDESGRPVHGTLATAAAALDRIAGMGFDVVYLPPIHPIGHTSRKGRDNRVAALPGDVGSPWAIGASAGGHDAVHPDLGTIDDFDAFVGRARELGLEIALDLALQCSPDHPWVTGHPEWFRARPDGTIAYAENPPKRYQDIYPLDFETDMPGIQAEVLRVVEHWIAHGVRVFRVDNPHTKPPALWHWLIWTVKERHPDVLFLAEAFTRPARLFGLARLGFTQSYTYFTWRDTQCELAEFAADLVARCDEMRPNLFVNTPDILPKGLQRGGMAAFALRAALAATLSPTWGVYSGFELGEADVLAPGGEEYAASERFELRPRDFAAAVAAGTSLEPWLERLNEIRRAHPALLDLRSLRCHPVANEALIAYSKRDPASGEIVLCVVTLDPETTQECVVEWDLDALGLPAGERFSVYDEVSGEIFEWGESAYVKLDPRRDVAHIAVVIRS